MTDACKQQSQDLHTTWRSCTNSGLLLLAEASTIAANCRHRLSQLLVLAGIDYRSYLQASTIDACLQASTIAAIVDACKQQFLSPDIPT
jgi:hypothetical protein